MKILNKISLLQSLFLLAISFGLSSVMVIAGSESTGNELADVNSEKISKQEIVSSDLKKSWFNKSKDSCKKFYAKKKKSILQITGLFVTSLIGFGLQKKLKSNFVNRQNRRPNNLRPNNGPNNGSGNGSNTRPGNLGSNNAQNLGAANSQTANLQANNSNDECPVCMENFNATTVLKNFLPCAHAICQGCIVGMRAALGAEVNDFTNPNNIYHYRIANRLECPICRIPAE